MKGVAEHEIERINWAALREASGHGASIGPALAELISADSVSAVQAAYWRLENHIVAQGAVYEAAEESVTVLLAALVDPRPEFVRVAVIELLFQVINGHPAKEEIARGNGGISDRCRQRCEQGLWLLVREFVGGQPGALEVVELLDPARGAQLRSWFPVNSDGRAC